MISIRQNISSTSVSSNVQSQRQSRSTLSSQNHHTISSVTALELTRGGNPPLEQSSASILHISMHPAGYQEDVTVYPHRFQAICHFMDCQHLHFPAKVSPQAIASSNDCMASTQESGHIQYPKSTPHKFTNRDINSIASLICRYSPIQTELNNTSLCSFPKTAQANDTQALTLFAPPGPDNDTVMSLQSS